MPSGKLKDFWRPFSNYMKNRGVGVSSIGRKTVKRDYDVPVELLDSFFMLEHDGKKILVRFDYPEDTEWYEEKEESPAEDTLFKFYRIEKGKAEKPWTYYFKSVEKAKKEIEAYLTRQKQTGLGDFVGEEEEKPSKKPKPENNPKKEERKKSTGVTREQVEKRLPEGVTIEGEGEIMLKFKQTEEEYYGVVFINENGSRRISRETSEKVVKVLEDLTDYNWFIDSVSNFVIHYKPREKPKMNVREKWQVRGIERDKGTVEKSNQATSDKAKQVAKGFADKYDKVVIWKLEKKPEERWRHVDTTTIKEMEEAPKWGKLEAEVVEKTEPEPKQKALAEEPKPESKKEKKGEKPPGLFEAQENLEKFETRRLEEYGEGEITGPTVEPTTPEEVEETFKEMKEGSVYDFRWEEPVKIRFPDGKYHQVISTVHLRLINDPNFKKTFTSIGGGGSREEIKLNKARVSELEVVPAATEEEIVEEFDRNIKQAAEKLGVSRERIHEVIKEVGAMIESTDVSDENKRILDAISVKPDEEGEFPDRGIYNKVEATLSDKYRYYLQAEYKSLLNLQGEQQKLKRYKKVLKKLGG